MKRTVLFVIGVAVVVAVVAAGLAAAPSGQRHPHVASPPCRTGVVAGMFRYQAGLDNTWHPMHGVIIFRPARVSHLMIRVGVPRSGRFRISLPLGTWLATGHSRMFTVNGVEATCTAGGPLRVSSTSTVLAFVQCIGK